MSRPFTFLRSHEPHSHRQGYVTLFSVILVGAIGLVITVSVLLDSIISTKNGLEMQQKVQSRMAATTCAEQALQNILDYGTAPATATLTLPFGNCTYVITSTTSYPLVQAKGVIGNATSKINVILASSTPRIKLSSWKEVADF